jgi:hypothetical protein
VVPIPNEPEEGIKVKLEAVIPIEVVDALDTKVTYCGVAEVDVEILNEEPPLLPIILIVAIPEVTVTVEIPEPMKLRSVAPVPTIPPAVLIPTPEAPLIP